MPHPGRFTPGKDLILCRRLGGPQTRYGRVRKFSPTPGFDPQIVQIFIHIINALYMRMKVPDSNIINSLPFYATLCLINKFTKPDLIPSQLYPVFTLSLRLILSIISSISTSPRRFNLYTFPH